MTLISIPCVACRLCHQNLHGLLKSLQENFPNALFAVYTLCPKHNTDLMFLQARKRELDVHFLGEFTMQNLSHLSA